MDESMKNRLIQIDNECNEQIDRFGLIFNAAELVGNEVPSLNNLAKINLAKLIFAKLFNDGTSFPTNSAALKIKPNLSICSLHSLSI